jgi:hypothetical protein
VADSTIVFLVLAGVVLLFVSNRVPVEIVAFATALTPLGDGRPRPQPVVGGVRRP